MIISGMTRMELCLERGGKCLRRSCGMSLSKGKFVMRIGWTLSNKSYSGVKWAPQNEVGVPLLLWGCNNGLVMYDSSHNGASTLESIGERACL